MFTAVINENMPLLKIKQFFMDEQLYKYVFSPEQCSMIENHTFRWSEDKYLVFTSPNKQTMYGVIKYRAINDCLLEFHPYVKKELWGTDASYIMHKQFKKWAYDTTYCHKLITFIPETLYAVRKSAENHQLSEEGRIYAGAFWGGKLQDLVIYTQLLNQIN